MPDQVAGPAAALRALEELGVVWPGRRLADLIARVRTLVEAWGSTQPREEGPPRRPIGAECERVDEVLLRREYETA